MGMSIGAATERKTVEVSQKLKIEQPYTEQCLLGIYPKKLMLTSRRYTHPNVHSSTIYNCRHRKQPKSTNRQTDKKMSCIPTVEYYSMQKD